jgi:hypothetical protein
MLSCLPMYGFQSPPIASPGKEVAQRMAAATKHALIAVFVLNILPACEAISRMKARVYPPI